MRSSVLCRSWREPPLLVIRILGEVGASTLFTQVRAFMTEDPRVTLYPQIVDTRTWIGMLADQDLEEQMTWVRALRAHHGLDRTPLPPVVYLTEDLTIAGPAAARYAEVRRQPVVAALGIDQAYDMATGMGPAPKDVAAFLGQR